MDTRLKVGICEQQFYKKSRQQRRDYYIEYTENIIKKQEKVEERLIESVKQGL